MDQAISLGPCRRPIEFLTSWHPCGGLSKIPNSQIHKVKKWKILSNFPWKDFFVISHGNKGRFFVVIRPKKTLGHIEYWPRIDLFFSKIKILIQNIKYQIINWKNWTDFIIQNFKILDFSKVPYFCQINSGPLFYMSGSFFGPNHYEKSVFMFMRNYKEILPSEVA